VVEQCSVLTLARGKKNHLVDRASVSRLGNGSETQVTSRRLKTTASAELARPTGVRPIASGRHTTILLAILLGTTVLLAATVRRPEAAAGGSHVVRYLVLTVGEWLMFLYTALGLRRAGTPLTEIFAARWRSIRGIGATLAWAAGFWLVKSAVLLATRRAVSLAGLLSAVQERRTMLVMAPHGGIEVVLWILLSISAGVCEEFVYRGYLQRQLGQLARSAAVGLVLSSLVFGLGHLYQGIGSVLVITIYGLLFGGLAMASRSLAPGILAHACEDLVWGLIFSPLTSPVR
jgi:CAAX protease family protein